MQTIFKWLQYMEGLILMIKQGL